MVKLTESVLVGLVKRWAVGTEALGKRHALPATFDGQTANCCFVNHKRHTKVQLSNSEDSSSEVCSMCIALITTAHPEYPFILLNNRDVTMPKQSGHVWRTDMTSTGISKSTDCKGCLLAVA